MSLISKLKSSYKESANTALDSVSAMQTLLTRYPVVNTTSLNGNSTTNSMSFMFSILSMIGVSQNEIIEFFVKLLSGKGADGFLKALEYTVKGLLLANIKNLLTCSLNPLLPDKFMYPAKEDIRGRHINGEGIPIKIDDIDIFGMLEKSPLSKDNGAVFYFDALTPIYNSLREKKNIETITPNYSPNQLWESQDFNSYLWYIIHREPTTERPYYWDNRNRVINSMVANDEFREKFFNTVNDSEYLKTKYQKIDGKKRYEIIRCTFEESPNRYESNILRVYINPWRYANRGVSVTLSNSKKTGVKKQLNLNFNSTVFEFNFEYIWSLQIFETKTLIANILNAIFGLSASINFSLSMETEIIKGRVKQLVEQIIEMDDTEIDDCYFTFDNAAYDALLEQTKLKYDGKYQLVDGEVENTFDTTELNELINDIDNASDLVEQQEKIKNVFSAFLVSAGTADQEVDNMKFSFGSTIIDKLLKETITQIVLQILSPKVAVLFKINSAIMGDIDPENINSEGNFDSWSDFLKNFNNLLVNLITEIKNMILQYLYEFMMSYLRELIQLFALELLKEAIRDYRLLIKNILENCVLSIPSLSFGFWGNRYKNLEIDNVNYADIVPTATAPNKDTCG